MADTTIQKLKDKLSTMLRQKELAAQKAKMLEEQATRDRQREDTMTQLVQQLMDRQRELNIMLNRSNLMLHRSHEANLALSLEFTELCHALPAPEDPEIQDRIKRINDLFTRTGIEDAELTPSQGDQSPAAQDTTIVTPPPQDLSSGSDEADAENDSKEEPTFEGIVREFIDEPVPEPEVRPVVTPSLEELFRRTGVADETAYASETAQSVPLEAEPVSQELDSESAEPVSAAADGGRRWWQLLGRR